MSAKTPTEALSLAPASASKTAVIAAADALQTAIDNAVVATAIGTKPADMFKEHFVDLLEVLATNMRLTV